MAQKAYELKAEIRTQKGKSTGRRLRREDKVPAIMYGAGQEPVSLTLDHNVMYEALKNQAFYSHILTIDIADKKEQAILRAIQRHPYKPKLLHIDFQRISAKEKLTMNVPLHFVNEDIAPGVVEKEGVISHLLSSVEISCLPADLPEYIDVDVAKLDLGESLHLSDLKLPEGVELIEILHDNDLPVISIHEPRVIEEETAAPVAEETAVGEEAAPEEPKEE